MKIGFGRVFVMPCLLIGVCCWSAGCGGGSDQPDIGHVTGKVTLDQAPLPGATVYFRPVDGGRNSMAITAEDGSYELTYVGEAKGAAIGKHLVRVTTLVEEQTDDEGQVTEPGIPEKVPEKYNEKSDLHVEVKAGENQLNLELVSQ